MFEVKKMRTMIAVKENMVEVDCIISVKEWTGVHRFTGGVSP